MTFFRTLLARLDAVVTALPSARRAALAATAVAASALVVVAGWWVVHPRTAAGTEVVASSGPTNDGTGRPAASARTSARADAADGGAPADDGGPLAYQRGIERATEQRIESLLATVVGAGKVVARVAAAVDFARTERTEETYDPDKTALRETRSTREQAPGGKGAAASDGAPRTERRDDAQSYEVSKVVSRTVAPVGTVKSLSVAVLVDGTYRDEAGVRTFVPRSDEEIEKLKTLVASAAGLSEARGDRLEITSAPFQTSPEADDGPGGHAAASVPRVAAWTVGLGLVLALAAVLVRALARRDAPAPGAAVGGRTAGVDTALADRARENVALAQQHPERVAQLVRQWLLEEAKTSA